MRREHHVLHGFSSAGGSFGSCSNTSRPAPAICLFFSARTSAFSSITGAARGIDDESGRLHQGELLVRDHVPGFGVERRMQRHEIGFRQQPLERHMFHAELLLGFRLAARGPIKKLHAEAARAPRGGLADAAGADQADGLAVHEAAGEMVRLRAGKFSGAHQFFAFDHAARHRQHQAEMHVGGRLRHDRRHHGHRYAALGRLRPRRYCRA